MRRTMDAARRDDVRETLHAVRGPALVVRGRHDRICPGTWAAEVARHAPVGSGTVTLPVGGHMVPLTHGVPLAAAVRQFLDGRRVGG
jgi:pimeloyl-ACP methyl ester carboxylesterase